MAKALFKVLFLVVKAIANVFLTPANVIVSNFFPNFTTLVARFNAGVSAHIGSALGYFAHLLPPYTKQFILLYITLLIAYYTMSIAIHLIMKVIIIIKTIKIW